MKIWETNWQGRKGSLVVTRAVNGFVAQIEGTIEETEDGLNRGTYAFESVESLVEFVKEYCEEKNE